MLQACPAQIGHLFIFIKLFIEHFLTFFYKYDRIIFFKTICKKLLATASWSTCPPCGNQVDGLPLARNVAWPAHCLGRVLLLFYTFILFVALLPGLLRCSCRRLLPLLTRLPMCAFFAFI